MECRKFLTILAVFLAAVLIVQPVLSENVTARSDNLENDVATGYFNNAEQLVVKGDYENAIKLFDQALASNTTMLEKTDALLYLYRDKAYAQIQLENYSDAAWTLDAGLAIYPSDAMLWNNKGYALYRTGKTQDALAAYDTAISHDATYTNAFLNRGNLLNEMGRYSEAAATFIQANETDPFNLAASDGLAAARKGESEARQTMTLIIVFILVLAIGIVVWYVRFRKPADPVPEETRKKSRKK